MILELKEVNKRFERSGTGQQIINKVNLRAKTGDFIGITGRSGSGKSTLFHMIAGLLKPSDGTILIDNINITAKSQKRLSAVGYENVGYILQGQNLLSNFTAIDNVCMPCYMRKGKKEIVKRGLELLKLVGLEDKSEEYPFRLSGGEQQRIAIARALITSPSLLLADEPTANLDIENSLRIIQLLKSVSRNGTVVLVNTHNIELLPYFDKLYAMTEGQLIPQGNAYFG